jgi:hypothetical protein
MVLELQASLHAVDFTADHHEGRKKPDHFKVLAQFLGVPNLSVLGFQGFSAAGLGVDLNDSLATIWFGGVGHR